MQLRWIIAIAVWTILSGPVFTRPPKNSPSPQGPVASASDQASSRSRR
jgi:hypothetical protein